MNYPELADALLRRQEEIIQAWLEKIAGEPSLAALAMTPVLRRDHAHQILGDVALRLRGENTIRATEASERYARGRLDLGYTPEMEATELNLLALAVRENIDAESGRLLLLTELLGAAHRAVIIADRLQSVAGTVGPAAVV